MDKMDQGMQIRASDDEKTFLKKRKKQNQKIWQVGIYSDDKKSMNIFAGFLKI